MTIQYTQSEDRNLLVSRILFYAENEEAISNVLNAISIDGLKPLLYTLEELNHVVYVSRNLEHFYGNGDKSKIKIQLKKLILTNDGLAGILKAEFTSTITGYNLFFSQAE